MTAAAHARSTCSRWLSQRRRASSGSFGLALTNYNFGNIMYVVLGRTRGYVMIRIYNRIIVDVQRQLTKPRLFCQEAVIHPSTGAVRYAADKHCCGGIVTREETK